MRIIEIFLGQIVLYSIIFFMNAYIGFLLCLVIAGIAMAILILSFVFEFIERSGVPRFYYLVMLSAVISPLLVLVLFVSFDPTALDWMKE